MNEFLVYMLIACLFGACWALFAEGIFRSTGKTVMQIARTPGSRLGTVVIVAFAIMVYAFFKVLIEPGFGE
jgi:hypothetical protein